MNYVMDESHRVAFQRFFKDCCPACGNANWSNAWWRCASPENGGCGFISTEGLSKRGQNPENGAPQVTKARSQLVEEALAWAAVIVART